MMAREDHEAARARFGPDPERWPEPYRSEARGATPGEADAALDRLVLEAAAMPSEPERMARAVLARAAREGGGPRRTERRRAPGSALAAAGVAGLLALGGLAGYGAAGASLGDGAGLLGLALGDVSPGGLALAEIGAGEAG